MVADIAEPSATQYDLLLIDDHPGERTIVREALAFSAPRIAVHETENAVQAFWFLSKQREYRDRPTPDLILLDLAMPVIDGKRVLEVIRRDQAWRRLPVLVLTNSSRDLDLAACHDLGADGFVTKPTLWQDYLELGRVISEYLDGGRPLPRGIKAHFFARCA